MRVSVVMSTAHVAQHRDTIPMIEVKCCSFVFLVVMAVFLFFEQKLIPPPPRLRSTITFAFSAADIRLSGRQTALYGLG